MTPAASAGPDRGRHGVRSRPHALRRAAPGHVRVPVVFSTLSHLECSRDGSRHDADVVQGTSPLGAPLLARYDLERAAAAVTRAAIAARPPDLWRYHEMLPVRDAARVVTLGEGMTPLLDLPRHGARLGVPTAADEGRGSRPDRVVQGARRGGRGVAGRGAGRHGDRDADQRQRGRGVGRLRRPRGSAGARGHAGGRAGHHPS